MATKQASGQCLPERVHTALFRARARRALRGGRREQMPGVRHAFEFGKTVIGEFDARAVNEVRHRSRYEYLVRTSERGDTCGDVDGDPGDVVADHLALSRVDAGAHGYA